ncbi:sensory rhodopsin transducer [Micromonospora sp. NBC_01813]|uniref:sensory rhodopsin transducer n=1 Tax=Micromonospora sp. NBC_01813 TaxID=2975988 RepID=UPI002DD830DE|nr:sensory rhodopsin transducer [Micromonospora sp. NBC_01813]WSA08771.1 sensory rhodopsin transducer [Micromonospora sp. NBC_01813]
MAAIGARTWVVSGGRIPADSNGEEPEFTGFDQLCLLNAGDSDAEAELVVHYEDQEPVGPYPVRVWARRIRHVRLNDLVDPEPIRLGRPFGCVLTSSVPLVVQFQRQDTRLPGVVALTDVVAYATG